MYENSNIVMYEYSNKVMYDLWLKYSFIHIKSTQNKGYISKWAVAHKEIQ